MMWRRSHAGVGSPGGLWSADARKTPRVAMRKSPGKHSILKCGPPQDQCRRQPGATSALKAALLNPLFAVFELGREPVRAEGTCTVCHACSAAQEGEAAREEEEATARQIRIKISIAQSTGRLDLSECGLASVPPEVFGVADLRDLSLAGNSISELPKEINRLTCLERLVLAGNLLTGVPDEIGALTRLKGMWIHGNLLETLPDSMANLTSLAKCSLAGNLLETLPPSFGLLCGLLELDVSGNRLVSLPDSFCSLAALRVLKLHGNCLRNVPECMEGLLGLEELWLQGNSLTSVAKLPANLKHLSLADNLLDSFGSHAGCLENLKELRILSLYGNQLQDVLQGLLALPKLKSVWLEGNPLSANAVARISSPSGWGPSLTAIGLDDTQCSALKEQAVKHAGKVLKISQRLQSGHGYFKLAPAGGSDMTGGQLSSNGTSAGSMLVVAFGSAPGVPNWGGLLHRVESAIAASAEGLGTVVFDTLFVVDPKRSWYGASEFDDAALEHYRGSLQAVTSLYDHVVMLGDSMGASGALLFAPMATSVLAFCPQVDLSSSSIRPASGGEGWARLRENVLEGVHKSSAGITVLTGSWEHDMEQVRQLPLERINWKVFHVDTHRLAIHMDNADRLLPLVMTMLAEEARVPAGTVRSANML